MEENATGSVTVSAPGGRGGIGGEVGLSVRKASTCRRSGRNDVDVLMSVGMPALTQVLGVVQRLCETRSAFSHPRFGHDWRRAEGDRVCIARTIRPCSCARSDTPRPHSQSKAGQSYPYVRRCLAILKTVARWPPGDP
jgi:hypothetical protein